MKYHVFISHASEDKQEVVRPLAEGLEARGLKVWLDEVQMTLGDNLRREIDKGLAQSRYGVVVLSPDYLRKEWPLKELDSLMSLETGLHKKILPIWHKVNSEDIAKYSPLMAGKLAAPSSKGLNHLINEVVRAVGAAQDGDSDEEERPGASGHAMHQLIVDLLDRVVQAADNQLGMITGVRTGLVELDSFMGGLQPGTLSFVAGRPLHGKTAFALAVAQHVAMNEGLPVLLYTPSATARQTAERMFCSDAQIAVSHLRAGTLSDDEWPRLVQAVERFRTCEIHLLDDQALSVEELQAQARKQAKLWGRVGLIVIDAVQDIPGKKGGGVRDIVRALRALARELNCPVLVTSNLPRSVELRVDKRPTIADLAEIEDLTSSADRVMFLFRRALYERDLLDPGMLEVLIPYQRDAPRVGTVLLDIGAHGVTGRIATSAD
ncbi:DnaB-like helicase C-terminal domain-containing protein [Variovorax sp. PDC80]|uniref:DnaB-like helicase C-terminal domain-containing protein n=1 Tax=Variovorax sp. PDC80 TaxID=1882827 RepID=UPI000B837642|nr:DnaB-like helicase C-terminal domain-containing protein [Variovorax sp. PDC80]